jgi:hypothetical protein
MNIMGTHGPLELLTVHTYGSNCEELQQGKSNKLQRLSGKITVNAVNPDPDPTLLFNFGDRSRTGSGFGSRILHIG